jgi:hypothetical protein
MKEFAGNLRLAVWPEENGIGQAEAHKADGGLGGIDVGDGGAGEVEPIDLDALGADALEEGLKEGIGVGKVMECGMDEVNADETDGVLLARGGAIPETKV